MGRYFFKAFIDKSAERKMKLGQTQMLLFIGFQCLLLPFSNKIPRRFIYHFNMVLAVVSMRLPAKSELLLVIAYEVLIFIR